jgi:hypothetical protein
MTAPTAAAMTVATAVAETKAAVVAAMAAPTAVEAVTDVAAMGAETLFLWQWLPQLQLWHVGTIVLLSNRVTFLVMSGQMRSPGERTVTLEMMCV